MLGVLRPYLDRQGQPGPQATNEVGGSYIVVNTGPWIFGKKVMLPACVIQRIDPENETAYADRTKDEIKNAPDLDDDRLHRRARLGGPSGREAFLRVC